MGWGGGTEYFDGALDIFLGYIPEKMRPALIERWYEIVSAGDWDTENESSYWDQLEPILRKRYPDWDWD